jgi:hypothetical protein
MSVDGPAQQLHCSHLCGWPLLMMMINEIPADTGVIRAVSALKFCMLERCLPCVLWLLPPPLPLLLQISKSQSDTAANHAVSALKFGILKKCLPSVLLPPPPPPLLLLLLQISKSQSDTGANHAASALKFGILKKCLPCVLWLLLLLLQISKSQSDTGANNAVSALKFGILKKCLPCVLWLLLLLLLLLQISKSQSDTGANHAVSALKFGILKKFLQLGWAVLLSDIDVCVLQDPFKHLYRCAACACWLVDGCYQHQLSPGIFRCSVCACCRTPSSICTGASVLPQPGIPLAQSQSVTGDSRMTNGPVWLLELVGWLMVVFNNVLRCPAATCVRVCVLQDPFRRLCRCSVWLFELFGWLLAVSDVLRWQSVGRMAAVDALLVTQMTAKAWLSCKP